MYILHYLAKEYGDPEFPGDDDTNTDDEDEDDLRNEDEIYLRRLGEVRRQEVVQYLQRH